MQVCEWCSYLASTKNIQNQVFPNCEFLNYVLNTEPI